MLAVALVATSVGCCVTSSLYHPWEKFSQQLSQQCKSCHEHMYTVRMQRKEKRGKRKEREKMGYLFFSNWMHKKTVLQKVINNREYSVEREAVPFATGGLYFCPWAGLIVSGCRQLEPAVTTVVFCTLGAGTSNHNHTLSIQKNHKHKLFKSVVLVLYYC
jgi:hypothetical protein